MSILSRSSTPFNPYSIVAEMPLPLTRSIAIQIRAIRTHYHHQTGLTLTCEQAVDLLDRLRAERDDVPFPANLCGVAEYLIQHSYTRDAVHEIIGHIQRHGTAWSATAWLERADVVAVDSLVPNSIRNRAARAMVSATEDGDEGGEGGES